MWSPDTELLEQSRSMCRDAAQALAGELADDVREEEASSLLEAAGTLVGLGVEDEVRGLIRGADAARAACETYLASVDLSALDRAAVQVTSDAISLMLLDPEDGLELAHELRQALDDRDRIELLRMGAEVVCPQFCFDAEQESSWLCFDEMVGAELWRLLSLGDTRWVPAAWMKPEMRSRFPWRTRGYGMGREALDSLSDAAQLLTHFPEAREHFEALMRTMQPREDAARQVEQSSEESTATDGAMVIDLSRWRERTRRDEAGRLNVAAADQSAGASALKIPGVEGLVDLELEGASLVAYLIPNNAKSPRLEWAGGVVAGELVPGTHAAYRFDLPAAGEVTLVIPVGDEERRVVLRGHHE